MYRARSSHTWSGARGGKVNARKILTFFNIPLGVLVLALISGSVQAQTFKCVTATGRTEYRGSPCDDARQEKAMTGGAVSGVPAMSQREIQQATRAEPAATAPSMTVIGGAKRGVPTERDIKNLETSAGSITLNQKEKKFMQDELRRAKLARETGAEYTEQEKRELEYLRSSQTRVDPADRESARRRAEEIHMRAGGEAVRQDVTETRRAGQAQAAARRQAALEAAAQREAEAERAAEQARRGPTYDRITQCIAGTCQGSTDTYRSVPGLPGKFNSSSGKSCTAGPTGELTCY
jgi:hypothetical protein